MKDLLKLWLWSKVIGEFLTLFMMGLSIGFVAWAAFYFLPKVIGKVFMF